MTLIHKLLDLMATENTLLKVVSIGEQSIEIHQQGHYRWVYTSGHSIQSVLNLDAPAQMNLLNQDMMLVALLLLPEWQLQGSPRVLNLGFGGGSFERFFHAKVRNIAMVSVDINAQLVELAKQYLQVPANWPVVIQPGEDFLQSHLQQTPCEPFQLIICDLFDGEYQAQCLNDPSFYANAASNLTDDGVMTVNLAPKTDAQLIELLGFARHSFAGVMISKVTNLGNIVMVMSKQSLPSEAVLKDRALQQENFWQLTFVDFLAGFKRLPEKVSQSQAVK